MNQCQINVKIRNKYDTQKDFSLLPNSFAPIWDLLKKLKKCQYNSWKIILWTFCLEIFLFYMNNPQRHFGLCSQFNSLSEMLTFEWWSEWSFLAPTGAQEILIFVHLFVFSGLVCLRLLIFIFWAQTHFKSTQRALSKHSVIPSEPKILCLVP